MSTLFTRAVRTKAKLRMALTGVSGAGKTVGALYIAYGITGDWAKVALIDTEHERARFYADRSDLGIGGFLHASLEPPYSVDRYKEYVAEAARVVGPDGVVIIDSLSHAWSNEGGVLDAKDKIAERKGQNSYTAWNEAGKLQNDLINSILSVECHTIATMRSKMAYTLEENERGKQQPVKLGLAPIQREDTEYEFDIVLNVDRTHVATTSKDTTMLDRFGEVITPELGQRLAAWLNDGAEPERYTCADCGATLRALQTENATASARQLAEGTQKAYGRILCGDCATKAKAAKLAAQKEAALHGSQQ